MITSSPPSSTTKHANIRLLFGLCLVVGAMTGLAFASVPLYRLFCQVTGFGGTTQVASEAPIASVLGEQVHIRFDANVHPDLNWSFQPLTKPALIKIGEPIEAIYRVTNKGDTASIGTSVFNVTPQKAGPYFMKMECFCFTEQQLEAGQSMDMAVTFFIDRDISIDDNTATIDEIVLSYTFFKAI